MSPSPWHEGEVRLQQRVGVAERMDVFGRKVIRNFMPEQHREFYTQLPFLVMGTVDENGAPWATVLEGQPGFLSSPDARSLRIGALPGGDDPALPALFRGADVGLLGIELHTRRRNRLNGAVETIDGAGFTVGVGQAFGNCPQYIQLRSFTFADLPAGEEVAPAERSSTLDAASRSLVESADTFFVASYVDAEGDAHRRSVDVSHRGGKAGFVRIDGDVLTIPDFAGNLHFNTLGNLLVNPRAGLLFLDFANGTMLHLTGSTELVLEGKEISSFQGAERLWRFRIEQVVRRPGALRLRWDFHQYSPNSLLTGSWEDAALRERADALRQAWRPFRVTRVVRESATISSFHLQPADGAGLPTFQAGQHLPIRVRTEDGGPDRIRTYTISAAPSDDLLRISVKKEGAVSRYLHENMTVGRQLEARGPDGSFLVDASERRALVLISAGVGITPMLAMLRHVVYEGQRTRRTRRTYFFHGARTAGDRPFEAELEALVGQANGAITRVRALTQPENDSTEGVDFDFKGRIDIGLLQAVLPFGDHDFYLCGPASFTQELYDGLRALRIPDDRIHAEAFGPSTLKRSMDPGQASLLPPLAPAAVAPVSVTFARSALETLWQPESGSLLELAEAQGLTPEFSCRGGSCGTCRTRVLEGDITYRTHPPAPVGPGETLICCALPAASPVGSSRLVLDL